MLGRRIALNKSLAISRGLSTRASGILSSLGISTKDEIPGVYDGSWRGSGDILTSVCPTTGEVLAKVRSANPQELHEALDRTREAYKTFRGALESVPWLILRCHSYRLQTFQHRGGAKFCAK